MHAAGGELLPGRKSFDSRHYFGLTESIEARKVSKRFQTWLSLSLSL